MRRRILQFLVFFIVLSLCLVLGLWGYISTHQEQIGILLSNQLSSTFKTPISLKQARLGFHPVPTLDFSELSISSGPGLKAFIPQLHVQLSWDDLIQGQFNSIQLTAIRPEIYWQQPSSTPGQTKASDTPSFEIEHMALPQLRLSIKKGHIYFSNAEPQKDLPWQLSEVDLDIRSVKHSQNIKIQGNANLRQGNGESMPISSQLDISDISNGLSNARLSALVEVQHMQIADAWQKDWPVRIRGIFDLHTNWQGSLNHGLKGNTTLTQTNTPIQVERNGSTPLTISELALSMRVTEDADRFSFDSTTLSLDKKNFQLEGFTSKHQTHFGVTINCDHIALTDLYAWLPAKQAEQLSKIASQGTITLHNMTLDSHQWPPSLNDVESVRANVDLQQLQINDFSQGPVRLSLSGSPQKIYLTSSPLRFDLPAGHIEGPLDVKLSHKDANIWQLNANLSQLSYQLAGMTQKQRQDPGELSCSIEKKNSGWSISQGTFKVPALNVNYSGWITAKDHWQVKIDIPELELSDFGQEISLLQWMELRGKVAVEETISQAPGADLVSLGKLTLTDCAISPTHTIAPIHHINGTAYQTGLSLEATDLQVGLGQSQLTVDAKIDNLRQPVAKIHARAKEVIAQDLIFHSPTAILHDLDGRIDIHAGGIDFERATVRLDQGTTATVTGSLNFHGPDLQLRVEAPYGDIDEVIALWHGPPGHGHTNGELVHHQVDPNKETLHIRAQVGRGTISGFQFSNATATIHYSYGRLRIEPLLFEADSGYGNGKVILYQSASPATLHIEGTVVNIDADKIYSQLLKHTGLVTGQLTGDFSINGPVGSTFLPNSNGVFSLTIKNGVLRKFKVLSKAFSLLNIAQLFSFKLPDMAQEGMPFSRLTSDISLKNGTLHSENLRIDSAAMNTVLAGDLNLVDSQIDLIMGIKPLGTVDTVFTRLPVAGWLLTGNERAVLSANFAITGSFSEPHVEMLPLSSLSDKVIGIFKRTLTLPGTLFKDPEKVLTNPDRSLQDD